MSARIDENGAKTEKLWLKQDYRGLFVRILERTGALGEETEDKNINKP